jgi:hypothetical protein
MKLTKKERILNTFNYKEIDRPPIYDVIHNIKFIEHVYGKSVNSRNAEDAVCAAAAKTCDMVRHFAIPYELNSHFEEDEDGFVYEKEWWTAKIVKRPFKNILEARELVKKDIFKIRQAIEEKKFCQQAKYNIQLFEDRCNSPEEMNSEFERIQNKLDGTVMVAPEQPEGSSYFQERYNIDTFIYLYNDYPDLVRELLAAYLDYRLFIIDSFAGSRLTPVAFTSTLASGSTGLIFSPSFIYRELFPAVKKILDKLKEKGFKVIYDFEGDSRRVLGKIVEDGADAYTPIEEMSGSVIGQIKKKYPKLVLGFVIDSINLLTHGNIKEITKKTIDTIKLAKDYGGIMIGSSAAIHSEVPVENALAMINTVKNVKF